LRSATEAARSIVPSGLVCGALLLGACSSAVPPQEQPASVEVEEPSEPEAAPLPGPDPDEAVKPDPEPMPEPEPDSAVRFRTFPEGHRNEIPGPTGFWLSGGYPEIAQSVVLDEEFLLTSVQFAVLRFDLLAGVRVPVAGKADRWAADDVMRNSVSDHTVYFDGTMGLADVIVTVWRAPDELLGERVEVSALEQLTRQTVTVEIQASGTNSMDENDLHAVEVVLPEPVDLSPGQYLIGLAMYEVDNPDLMALYVWGRQQGEKGDHADACDFPRAPDLYPQGRAYYRADGDPPNVAERTGGWFGEFFAKVMHYVDDSCVSGAENVDRQVLNPGDLELVLRGTVQS
jgi:hypothetical protein